MPAIVIDPPVVEVAGVEVELPAATTALNVPCPMRSRGEKSSGSESTGLVSVSMLT